MKDFTEQNKATKCDHDSFLVLYKYFIHQLQMLHLIKHKSKQDLYEDILIVILLILSYSNSRNTTKLFLRISYMKQFYFHKFIASFGKLRYQVRYNNELRGLLLYISRKMLTLLFIPNIFSQFYLTGVQLVRHLLTA